MFSIIHFNHKQDGRNGKQTLTTDNVIILFACKRYFLNVSHVYHLHNL